MPVYPAGADLLLAGAWENEAFQVLLVRTAQQFSSSHRVVADLAPGVIVARAPLTGLSHVDGAADADSVTFDKPEAGNRCNLIVALTGPDNSATLLALIDQGGGLPIETVGGDVRVDWDNGPDRVFRLVGA